MPGSPRVTVIVPVHNGARFLADALTSIDRQGHPDLEVIVVDDGSTDGSAAIARGWASVTTVVEQTRAGPAAARNRGLALAHGDLVAFLDADDWWPDGKLARQRAHLAAHGDLAVSMGRTRFVAEDGAVLPDLAFDDPELHTVADVHLGSGLFRRTAFDTVGLFDEALRFGEDHDWFLRAREQGIPIRILPDVTLVHRLHRANMTLTRSPEEVALTGVLKRSLDRRRAAHDPRPLPRWRSFDEAAE